MADRRVLRAHVPGGAARTAGSRPPRVTFFFDLSSPFTYLAAERVERLFPGLVWRPVLEEVLQVPSPVPSVAEERAHALGLPLVWPELGPESVRPAMRVASLAAERGRAAPFVLAASRLAFCGGFELDHPEVLAEAAAAANLGLEDCLRAAGDVSRDGPMEEAARRLLAQGADRLPALRVGRLLFAGEDRIAEAAAAASIPAALRAV
ncbi:MAG TPA: DsbA family protein [Solirubrobacteraceae bacterium]|nr:DsbA family protein [Solirubrobacteraceae bacterium]